MGDGVGPLAKMPDSPLRGLWRLRGRDFPLVVNVAMLKGRHVWDCQEMARGGARGVN